MKFYTPSSPIITIPAICNFLVRIYSYFATDGGKILEIFICLLFSVPQPKFYVQIYPVQIQFDVITVLWLNTFFLNLHKSLLTTSTVQDRESVAQLFYFDVKVEVIMPHVSNTNSKCFHAIRLENQYLRKFCRLSSKLIKKKVFLKTDRVHYISK